MPFINRLRLFEQGASSATVLPDCINGIIPARDRVLVARQAVGSRPFALRFGR